MQYKVIRAGRAYDTVILVTPPIVEGWKDIRAKYYLFEATKRKGLKAISKKDAIGYFSGVADGIGYSDLPEVIFASQNEFLEWQKQASNQYYQEHPLPKETWKITNEILYKFDPEYYKERVRLDINKFHQGRWNIKSISILEFAKRISVIAELVQDKELIDLATDLLEELEGS